MEKLSLIALNLKKLKDELPGHVKLIAVSKMHPPKVVMEAYEAGQRVFGENKAQELIGKQPDLPEDIEWHFVGHLQRNKMKYLAPFVAMIHSVDSLKLLREINKEGKKNERVIDCLLQFRIAKEETKFGLDHDEAEVLLNSEDYKRMEYIRICGVMGMATFTEDEERVRKEFRELKGTFDRLKSGYFSGRDHFKEISMGMTGDYKIAIEEGSTMVRIGTAIFGGREYS